MKKRTALSFVLGLSLLSFPALAMDATTLLAQPDRYRVVETNGNRISFVDTETLTIMETRDYPSSIGNIHGTLYVMETAKKPSAMEYQRNQLATGIDEYTIHLFGDKREGKHEMVSAEPVQSYNAAGDITGKPATFSTKSLRQLFINMMLADSGRSLYAGKDCAQPMITGPHFQSDSSSSVITWNDEKYTSAIRRTTRMETGMIAPEVTAEAYVYDKQAMRNVTLDELTDIVDVEKLEQAIRDGRAVLRDTRRQEIDLAYAFTPSAMPKQFYLDRSNNALVLVFQPGEIAPYPEGLIYAVISLN
ncbi:MAG: RsiV family protein [Veillonellaceae bacterium]|nr:RsiV family protein [Veillonellaceae bacterium]